MSVNLVIIIIGLIICFGGIYFKRVSAAILGFQCGVFLATLFMLSTVGLWGLDNDTMQKILIFAVIFAIVSSIYYKVLMVVNGFAFSFSMSLLLLLLLLDTDTIMVVLVLSLVLGIICAVYTYRYCDYTFIIMTAIMGGFTASLGGFGILTDCNVSEMMYLVLWKGPDQATAVLIGTAVLGVVGIKVQLTRLKATVKPTATNTEQTEGSSTPPYGNP